MLNAGPSPRGRTMTLLDVRDELAAARNLAAALYMACDARSMPAEPRTALCAASDLVRERLEVLVVAVDQLLAQGSDVPEIER